ncbi:MAG: serine--tRNA ligase [Bacteroidia bacterium]|nr:serine--tRNA ligase [Bacteroidia bacterium]
MLEIAKIRQKTEEIAGSLARKGVANAADVLQEILRLDDRRKEIITELEKYRAEMNQTSKSIGLLMREGKKEEAEVAKKQSADAKNRIKELEQEVSDVQTRTKHELDELPNSPHASVPSGKSADDNEVVFEKGVELSFDFSPKPHWELARQHDIIDWELGVKLTGAGFPVYKGDGAILQRALISFFLDKAREAGYQEIQPPLMVNEDSAYATGQLPDKEGQMYHIEKDGFYMIPTAEVPITNLYRNDIIKMDRLPLKNCGYTPCFRREAGSYGAHVKGLNRLHQFDKVELVQVCLPEKSYDTLEEMTTYVESLLEALELRFRRLLLCSGDMSHASAKTFDLEVFSAAQERWLEVSSVSNFETFQTNRLKLRYRTEENKKILLHSLNGSALALPRIVAALLENHQQADGSIRIPEALRPYTRFDQIG